MTEVVLEVRGLEAAAADFAKAWRAEDVQQTARIAFDSPELLWKVLTAKRWALLKALTGAGPVSARGAARLAGRDVKAVHGDLTALLRAGLLERASDGGVVFPYDAVHVDFRLAAA